MSDTILNLSDLSNLYQRARQDWHLANERAAAFELDPNKPIPNEYLEMDEAAQEMQRELQIRAAILQAFLATPIPFNLFFEW